MRQKIATAVLELTTEHGAFFKNLDEVENRSGRLDKSWRETGKSLQAFGRQTSDVGAALTKMSLPLLAVGVGAAKAAIEFESSFAGVRKTVNATEEEFAHLSEEFRDLAKTIPVNVNELNRLGEAAGALGIPKGEITDFARVMAMLGVTTNVTSDQAAESIAKIQNIFGAAGKDTERFASTLVALGNDGASTEHQILELANRIASAGNAVGLSQGQVLGYASAIANVGIEAEAGGTAISKVFIDISKAVSTGGSALDGFARVAGMSSAAYAKAFKLDAADATRLFIEGLGKIKNAGGDLNLTLEELGFTEVRQSNLLRSLALSGDNLTKSLDLQAKAWRENTALSKEAGERFKTLESQGKLLWNRLQDVAISLGNALVPTLKVAINAMNGLVPMLEGMVKTFTSLPAPIQATAIALGALAIAAGPVVFVAGQIITQFGVVMSTLFKVGNTVPVLTARIWLMEAGFVSFGSIFSGLATIARTVATALGGWVAAAFVALDVAIRALTGNSSSLFTVLRDIATVLGAALLSALSTVWGILSKWADTMATFVSGAAAAFLKWLRDSVPGLETVIRLVGDLANWMGRVAKVGTVFWSDQAQYVRDQRELADWLKKTSKQLEERSAAQKKAATSTDLLASANEVLAREWAAAEERARTFGTQTQRTEEELKAAKKAADDFKASLKALGGADAIAGAKEVIKQLQALGGPLNVLPSKLAEMAEQLRAGAEAAMTMKNVKLATEYTLLAKTLDPIVQFQQRFNVTIGEYITDADAATVATAALWEQFFRLSGQVQTIAPILKNSLNLKNMFVPFKESVTENLPDAKHWEQAWGNMREGLKTTLASIPATLARAFEGGGDIWGAVKSIGSQIGSAIGGAIGSGLTGGSKWGEALGAAVGSLVGPVMEGFKKLFGIGINAVVRKANDEIHKLRNSLLDTHGTLEQAEVVFNRVGLSIVENWGHKGPNGLKAMNALIAEMERRTEAVGKAADTAVEGFAAIAGTMTKPWIELGNRIKDARAKALEAAKAYRDLQRDEKGGAEELLEARQKVEDAHRILLGLLNEQGVAAGNAKQALADLGTQAMATFAAVLIKTGSFSEAIEAAGPSLTLLSQAYEALGIDVEDVGLKHLLLQARVAEGNPQLIAGISGLGTSMQALAQLGLLNVDTFAAMQRTGIAMYQRLQGEVAAAGGSTRDALLPMQSYLQQAAAQAHLLGIPLDANTQMLIDQSRELGIWKERGATAQDLLIAGMDRLVEKVGLLVDQLLGVSGAIGQIPTTHYINITAQYHDPGPPEGFGSVDGFGAIPMAEGGMGRVTQPTLFLAGEAGPEDVAFSGAGRRFAGSVPGGDMGAIRDELRSMKNAFAHQTELMISGFRGALAHFASS